MTRLRWIGCDFDGCRRPHRARGYCNGHLEQQRRGKPMTPLRTLPRFAWTYVAYWPDALAPGIGVFKVGRAWSRARVKGLVDRGARLISNTGNTDETWELWALRFLATEYEPAFRSAEEAADVLYRGSGWTECFAVPEEAVYEAMDLVIYGYSYGNERGVNDPSAYQRPAHPPSTPNEKAPTDASDPTPADESRKEVAPVSPLTPESRVTARALWLMTDASERREVDLPALAAKIYPREVHAVAIDTITLHILELEEAGYLSTYVVDGREWVQFHAPFSDAPGSPSPGVARHDSTASGGEGERARERARESVRAERARAERAWGALQERQASSSRRPTRPASIDAPLLGCPDHPHGSLYPCGPCGTARRQYDAFMDAQRYENKLADYEFWHGDAEEVPGDDEPF